MNYFSINNFKIYNSQIISIDGTSGTGPSLKGIWGTMAEHESTATLLVDENYIRESKEFRRLTLLPIK